MEINNIYPMKKCKNIELNINNNNTIKIYDLNSRHVPTNLFILKNCKVINKKLIYENSIFCYTWNVIKNEKFENKLYNIQNINLKCLENEIYFLLFCNIPYNYYHFWMDFIPKLYIYKSLNIDFKLLFNYSYFKDFQKQIMDLMEFDYNKIIMNANNVSFQNIVYHCSDSITFLTKDEKLPEYPIYCMRMLRNNLIQQNKLKQTTAKNIYISRKQQRERNVINEDKLMEFLKKYNFQIYQLENMNVIEQIELFYNANIVIAPHGAGSINVVFSENLKIYIEIHNKNYISMDSCFFQICTILNIPYVNLHAESTGTNMHQSNLIFENYDILKNILDKY